MIKTSLADGQGKPYAAHVTPAGALAVTQVLPSEPVTITLNSAANPKNFFSPVAGSQYIITDIILATNKDIGANGALVEIYEGTTEDTTTVSRAILTTQLLKNDSLALTGLHWKVNDAMYINAKTDDDTVYLTIAAYRETLEEHEPDARGSGADA